METLGFIILRHVKDEHTNQYWNLCYNRIRAYYPESTILIVDDNSNYNYINSRPLYKTLLVQSEYHGRGELLPYYYFLQHKLFDKAVILHDSVFLNSPIDTTTSTYKFLWDFEHDWDQIPDETHMIQQFDPDLMTFYENKSLWKGCFGCMTIITHDYLSEVNRNYNLSKLLPYVLNRHNRCSFERVIACLLQKNQKMECIFGDIHVYCPERIGFHDIKKKIHLPVIKICTGR
jgi:hypothetical protein